MDPIPGSPHILLCIAVFKVLSQCTAVCDVNPVINPLLFLVWSYNVDQITTIFPLLGTVTLKECLAHQRITVEQVKRVVERKGMFEVIDTLIINKQ